MDLSKLTTYQQNAWPAMVADLAADLGVTPASLNAIGIGWIPIDAAWVFPERDAEGNVVGLVRRFKNGVKASVTGSKRGLTYAVSPDFDPNADAYVPGSQNWTRCSDEHPCPICGKEDWCLLSSENPADPKAVICGRTPEGSIQPLGDSGYLHIRKDAGNVSRTGAVLQSSPLPVVVVEGASDVAGAISLGFVAVGKPSAEGGLRLLSELLFGRDVVVVGENDAGAGRRGMEKTFEYLKPKAKSVIKIMPPDGIKDLRAWIKAGLTAEDFRDYIGKGATTSSADLLDSIAPLDIADRWMRERHWHDGLPMLRNYAGYWYRFDGNKYARINEKTYVRGDLYAFLKGKTGKRFGSKGEPIIEPYEADAYKVSNIMDALTMTCPISGDAPFWLDDDEHPEIKDIVGFANGLLQVSTMDLMPATARFFSLTSIPYSWNPSATCPRWLQFLDEIFPHSRDSITLLQEWFGYNMVADTSQEKLMFFVGRPGAGKGTVLEGLCALLGSQQVASTSFDTLVGDFGLQPLLGKLAAIMPDAHMTKRSDPAKALQVLKEISGQDTVSINRKNKDFLTDHRLTCRFTISVNALPDLPDHERSLDRRLLLLGFDQCFDGRADINLKSKIAAEAQGIAVWALEGLTRLRAKGFTLPAESVPVINEFRRQSSPVSEFSDEYCTFEDYATPSAMLYDAYSRWCRDQGLTAGSHTRFLQRFSLLYPGCRTERRQFNGKQTRCMCGVRLKEEAIERYLVGRR